MSRYLYRRTFSTRLTSARSVRPNARGLIHFKVSEIPRCFVMAEFIWARIKRAGRPAEELRLSYVEKSLAHLRYYCCFVAVLCEELSTWRCTSSEMLLMLRWVRLLHPEDESAKIFRNNWKNTNLGTFTSVRMAYIGTAYQVSGPVACSLQPPHCIQTFIHGR